MIRGKKDEERRAALKTVNGEDNVGVGLFDRRKVAVDQMRALDGLPVRPASVPLNPSVASGAPLARSASCPGAHELLSGGAPLDSVAEEEVAPTPTP